MVDAALSRTVAGSPETARRGLADLAARTGADELMITAHMDDDAARLRSLALTAEARDAINAVGPRTG